MGEEWQEFPSIRLPGPNRTPRIDAWLRERRWPFLDRWEWVAFVGFTDQWKYRGHAPTREEAVAAARQAAEQLAKAAAAHDAQMYENNVSESKR